MVPISFCPGQALVRDAEISGSDRIESFSLFNTGGRFRRDEMGDNNTRSFDPRFFLIHDS